MDTATRNALVMDNYGWWVKVVHRYRNRRPLLKAGSFQDQLQEVLCKLIEVAGNYDGRVPFRNYGTSVIVRQLAATVFRDRLVTVPRPQKRDTPQMVANREAALSTGVTTLVDIPAKRGTTNPAAGRRKARELLGLLDAERAAYVKAAFGIGTPRLSPNERAEHFGVPRSTAYNRVDSAIRTLKRRVA